MVSNFADFYINRLFENKNKLKLVYSKRFKTLLKSIDDEVSNDILDMEWNDEYLSTKTYIDIDNDTDDRISFLITTKIDDIIDMKSYGSEYKELDVDDTNKIYNSRLRSTMKINKFVNEVTGNKYITKKLTDDEKAEHKRKGTKTPARKLSIFIDKFKAYRKPGDFEVVNGADIVYWYMKSNTAPKFEFSCMSDEDCKDYLDFYGENENVELLILKDTIEQGDDVIVGRALLWKTKTPEDRVFMDRVYVTSDKHKQRYIQLFINYATENGYLYKYNQDSQPNTRIVDPINNTKEYLTITVEDMTMLPTVEFPYLDTLKFYNPDKELISNEQDEVEGDNVYYLEDTSGGYSDIGGTREELVQRLIDGIVNNISSNIYMINPYYYWNNIDDDRFMDEHKENEKNYYIEDFNDSFKGDSKLIEYLYNNDKEADVKQVMDDNNIQYDKEEYPDYDSFAEDFNEILETLADNDILKIYDILDLKDEFCEEYIEDRYGDMDAQNIVHDIYGSDIQEVTQEKYNHLVYYFDEEGYARDYADSLSDDELRVEIRSNGY